MPKLKHSQILVVRVIFSLSVILLVLMSYFLLKRINRQVTFAEQANRTYLIRLYLEQMFSKVQSVEAGQRGFLLTGDSSFLQSFRQSEQNVNTDLTILDSLASGHDSKMQMDTLRSLVSRRLLLIDSILWTYRDRAPGVDPSELQVALAPGRKVMDQIRDHTSHLVQTEMQHLQHEQELKERYQFITPLFALLLIIFAFIVFTIAYISLNRQLRLSRGYLQQKQRALEDLKEMDVIYRNAEEVATLGSWQWNLQTNLFKCSDNLFRIYGSEPRTEEISFNRFMSFVVPEDREKLIDSIKLAIQAKEAVEATYRIIRSDNVIRHMRAYGKMRTDSSQIMLGATQDVTDLKLTNEKLSALNKELAAKNRELKQTNADLSSFNFIASHDLQEPLRKIQTFVSFVEESETNLSETGRFYLQRMQNAAGRIRVLIQDLLSYAHATDFEKEWSEVDLNVVLSSACQSLQQMMMDKKATIQAGDLPHIQGNAFQLQQLFEHILTNAIQYSKPDTPPVISITSVMITNNDEMLSELETGRSYHKISIADKGIGFEQEFAGKIFGLFQKLHSREDVGSGLGLAICKKIVQYHHGTIEARSAPDEGAVFEIYLPA